MVFFLHRANHSQFHTIDPLEGSRKQDLDAGMRVFDDSKERHWFEKGNCCGYKHIASLEH